MTKRDVISRSHYSCPTLESIALLTSPNCDYSDPESARVALELLQTVPITRDVVLETLFRFFLKTSQCHFSNISSNMMQKADDFDKKTGLSNENLDLCLSAKDALIVLAEKAPKVWLKVILKWSVQLLTSMAVQARATGAGYFAAPLEESISSWYLQCHASHAIMTVLEFCVSQVEKHKSSTMTVTPEEALTQIMSLVKDNLPNAEWIVAHLAVEYPELFLPALVDIGLKQMHELCDPQGLPLHLTMGGVSTSIKISLLESISYLSRFHKRLVQVELFAPLKKSVMENRTRYSLVCLSYILLCCEKFPQLLATSLEYCAEILTADILEKCMHLFNKAVEQSDQSVVELLIQQVVSLLMKNGTHSVTVFQFLVDVHCRNVCKRIFKTNHTLIHNFLHYWLLELQRTAQARFFSYKLSLDDQVFIVELLKNYDFLSEVYWNIPVHEQAFFIRFYLRSVCLADGDVFSAKLILHMMKHKFYRVNKFVEVLSLIKEINLALPNVYCFLVKHIVLLLPENDSFVITCLNSLSSLKIIQAEDSEYHEAKLRRHIKDNLAGFVKFLLFNNFHVNWAALQFLLVTKLDSFSAKDEVSLSVDLTSTLASSYVSCCVNIMRRRKLDPVRRAVTQEQLLKLATKMASSFSADTFVSLRNLILRSVVDIIFYRCQGIAKETSTAKVDTYISLLQQNRTVNRGKCSSMQSAISLDASTKRRLEKDSTGKTFSDAAENSFFMQLIAVLCQARKTSDNKSSKSSSPVQNLLDSSAVLVVAKRLIVQVCPNITSTLNVWNDLSMERVNLDLNIKVFNLFDNNPILWNLLELIAEVRPTLCYVTKLVSALLHVLITLWESSRCPKCAMEAKWVYQSCRLLALLHKAQFIPKQLSSLNEILPLVTPYEAMTILTFSWRYIQESPPDIMSYVNGSSKGYPDRNFLKNLPQQQSDAIHLIFLSNMSNLGLHFEKYFFSAL